MDKLFQLKGPSDGGNTRTSQQSHINQDMKQSFGNMQGQSEENLFGKREYEVEEGEFDSTMKLPVKTHLHKLEEQLEELKNDLENNGRIIQMARSDFIALEHGNKDMGSELTKWIMEELVRLDKEFRKLGGIEKGETNFLKQQVTQLNQDKIKLQQNCLILESRVNEMENDVGFKGLPDYRQQ